MIDETSPASNSWRKKREKKSLKAISIFNFCSWSDVDARQEKPLKVRSPGKSFERVLTRMQKHLKRNFPLKQERRKCSWKLRIFPASSCKYFFSCLCSLHPFAATNFRAFCDFVWFCCRKRRTAKIKSFKTHSQLKFIALAVYESS